MHSEGQGFGLRTDVWRRGVTSRYYIIYIAFSGRFLIYFVYLALHFFLDSMTASGDLIFQETYYRERHPSTNNLRLTKPADKVMLPQSPSHPDSQDDVKQLRTITSIYPITEEGKRDDGQQSERSTDGPLITRPDIHISGQQPEMTGSAPTESARTSSPANTSSATPAAETSTMSPLGRPPPSSKHHYLKGMWPGQPICHLCHKEYQNTNRAIRALPCGDIFHRACIDQLLGQIDGRCPPCKFSISVEWYMPHQYDPTKPTGSPCLCHPTSKAGTTTTTNTKNDGLSCTSPSIPAIRKLYKRAKEIMIRCTPGRKPKELYASYKTETGQRRFIKRETGVGLPDLRYGYADEEFNYRVIG